MPTARRPCRASATGWRSSRARGWERKAPGRRDATQEAPSWRTATGRRWRPRPSSAQGGQAATWRRRNREPDFVSGAGRVSQAAGAPVKVIWTRGDGMRNGFYRPTSYNRFSAGFDAAGRLVAWTHRIAGTPFRLKFGPLEKGIYDSLVDGAVDLPYAIPNLLVDQATLDLPAVPRGPWRSVGVSPTGFITKCFP